MDMNEAIPAAPATTKPVARLIALYLPQFHPIPENDAWWGKGFTEWTNTAKAKPMFPGHYQPHVPADLGFYDLRVPETRAAQATLAAAYGIEAFCYYHYWFAGRRVLERPFKEVLASGEPDFPFCLCWANQTWSGIWHGAPKQTLIEQTYPGDDDHRAHFATLLPAFRDRRYVTVDGKPVFIIYRPMEIPEIRRTTDLWRRMAADAGLPGLHLVGFEIDEYPDWVPADHGFDASVRSRMATPNAWMSWKDGGAKLRQYTHQLLLKYGGRPGDATYNPTVYDYGSLLEHIVPERPRDVESYPCVIPNWDNTPRSSGRGLVLQGSTPELFGAQLRRALDAVEHFEADHRIVIVKSWNEWAEGNHLEPDLRNGHRYLETVRDAVCRPTAPGTRGDGAPSSTTISLAGGGHA